MKNLKEKLTMYFDSLSDELRSLISHRKNKPRTPKLKKLCSFILAFSLLIYSFLGLFGCLKASAADSPDISIHNGSSVDLTITDLSGYTVTVPSGWTAAAGYGLYNVNGLFNGEEGMSSLALGYSKVNFSVETPASNTITWAIGGRYVDNLTPNNGFSVTFTSLPPDQSSLIQWFYDNNATFTSGDEPEEPDVPVLLTGSYVFDSNIFPEGIPSNWAQDLNFLSNGDFYSSMANDSGRLEYGSTVVYNHDAGGWVNDLSRYVTLSNNGVPLWFYQWFSSVTSPYTPLPSSSLEGLYFVSNTSIESSSEITFVRPFLSNSKYFNTIYFTNAISGDMISYVDSNNNQTVVWSEGSGWLEPQYSVILFNTSETISGEAYNTFSTYYTSVTNDSNLNLLYNAGLENGRDLGVTVGYEYGYSVGFADGEASALGDSFMGDFFGGIIDALDALTLFGCISVLDIIQGVLGLFIALWVLKLIAGG